MKASELKKRILEGAEDAVLLELYLDEHVLAGQAKRYAQLLDRFMEMCGDDEV